MKSLIYPQGPFAFHTGLQLPPVFWGPVQQHVFKGFAASPVQKPPGWIMAANVGQRDGGFRLVQFNCPSRGRLAGIYHIQPRQALKTRRWPLRARARNKGDLGANE